MKTSELRKLIKECVKTIINESIDTYDPEGDVSMYEPRDRMEEPTTASSLNIPHYPKSIIKPVNMDGKQKYFVYSDESNVALILGYGDSENDAIENAKKTATYIKQGGVGQGGELKEEHNYDEKDELKKINDILIVCNYAEKKANDPKYAALVIKQIQKICIDILKMHGIKEELSNDPYFLGDEESEKTSVISWIRKRLPVESNPANINALKTVMQIATTPTK